MHKTGCIEFRTVEKVTYLITYKNPITFSGMLNTGKKEHILSYSPFLNTLILGVA
jgi:hypothetical protein